MGNLRPALAIGLVFLAYMLWVEWQKDYGPQPAPAEPTQISDASGQSVPSVPAQMAEDLPSPGEAESAGRQKPGEGVPTIESPAVMTGESHFVRVVTDVLEAEIDLVGGTVVSASLLNYPIVLEEPDNKVNLLSRHGDNMFIAQSGLLSNQAAPNHTSQYNSDRMEYELAEGAQEIRVPLTWQSEDGVQVTKTFIFQRNQYDITVRHQLENRSAEPWSGSRYGQLQRSVPDSDDDGGFTNPGRYSFNGIAFYSPEEKFEKVDFDEVVDDPYRRTHSGGWLAMVQHYFFSAWIPPAEEEVTYSTQELKGNGWPRYIAREVSPQQQAAPGGRTEFSSRLYLGPKLQDQLSDVAPGLEHTVNYGIFTVISKPLYWLLSKIHGVVGNWGWAIVLLTVLIKAAFFKLTEAQYKSMARMRKLQPRIDQLKERYGDDRQRMSQAMMEMYKKEKVNPLGGCLPIVVQIPVFIALYWVLLESVELRQAPFILWIVNLSDRDPYFILPLLNASFMFATQRLTPMAGMDPLQRKMMSMMPLVFSIMFAFFPAGLVLYWATNAGLSLAQQYYITRKIAAQDN
jgi:YidC/Oxa1 family membrane protein insertase